LADGRPSIASIDDGGEIEEPIGTSLAWRQVIRHAARVAATDVTTSLEGESGTGKEVIARFIHRRSPRRHGPFIAINCAALPEQLLESELFGFERGRSRVRNSRSRVNSNWPAAACCFSTKSRK
jgi:transcriptional regulator with PAS, ATPase and Fis domain